MTRPGPFRARTHHFGQFWGIRREGQLVAMAGERMRLPGFSEVSGVCTHPDWRGHGFARALSAFVANRIQARGETPFLHAYADNGAAVGLYQDSALQPASPSRCRCSKATPSAPAWQHPRQQAVLQHIMVVERRQRVDEREDDDRPADPMVKFAQQVAQRPAHLADQRRDTEAEEAHRPSRAPAEGEAQRGFVTSNA